jgi:hypothetical protein
MVAALPGMTPSWWIQINLPRGCSRDLIVGMPTMGKKPFPATALNGSYLPTLGYTIAATLAPTIGQDWPIVN